MAAEKTLASGLVVTGSAAEEKPKPIVIRGFGSLKGEFFERIPKAPRDDDELDKDDIRRRIDECKVIVQQMRAEAFRDKDTSKLRDVHTLTHELQLAIGALNAMEKTGRRLYRPGDVG
jgi:hypothetical protein